MVISDDEPELQAALVGERETRQTPDSDYDLEDFNGAVYPTSSRLLVLTDHDDFARHSRWLQ